MQCCSSSATNVATPDFVACVERAAELFVRDLFAGDRLHDVGTGDVHVRDALHHEDEVGHRGRVDRATRARPEHDRDLRDHARRLDVAVEDAAVARERHDAFLDARAAAVVEADERRAGRLGEIHHLVDLLGVHLAERAAEDREVLAEHEDLAAVDGAPAGDDTVGERAVVLDPEAVRRWRASMSSSTNESGSSSRSMRSRAVSLPRSCWRRTDASLPGVRASSFSFASCSSRSVIGCGGSSDMALRLPSASVRGRIRPEPGPSSYAPGVLAAVRRRVRLVAPRRRSDRPCSAAARWPHSYWYGEMPPGSHARHRTRLDRVLRLGDDAELGAHVVERARCRVGEPVALQQIGTARVRGAERAPPHRVGEPHRHAFVRQVPTVVLEQTRRRVAR